MASLYPRGNMLWVSWKPPGKRRQFKSTGYTLAERALAEEDCARLTLLERQARRLLPRVKAFADVLADFLRAKRSEVEARTLAGYRTHANHFLRLMPRSRPFEGIAAENVRAYLRARVEEGAAPATANKERMTLLILWNWAQANELTERNPVRAVKPLPVRAKRAARQPVDGARLAEIVAVLRAEALTAGRADSRHNLTLFADMAEACYWTGWRFGEVCALRPEDVDLADGAIPLDSAANKGRDDAWPLPVEVREILARRVALGGAFVFGTHAGGHAYNAMRLFMEDWRDEHPAFADFTLHRLRHSYTTDLERSGSSGTVARRLTRHRSVQSHDVYLHANAAELRAAQERLATWRRRERERARRAKRRPTDDPPRP